MLQLKITLPTPYSDITKFVSRCTKIRQAPIQVCIGAIYYNKFFKSGRNEPPDAKAHSLGFEHVTNPDVCQPDRVQIPRSPIFIPCMA